MTDWNDDTRDRSFLPALETQEARARNASTDPRWDPTNGGLPEPAQGPIITWKGGTYVSAPSLTSGSSIVSADDALRADEQSQHTVVPLVLNPEMACDGLSLGDARFRWNAAAGREPSTIDPPTADPLSPAQRAELERILLDMDVARERLRKLLERAP